MFHTARAWARRHPGLLRWARRLAIATLVIAAAGSATLAVAVYGWDYDLSHLERSAPIIITDRHGRELRTVPAAGSMPARESWVSLDELPPIAIAAVVQSEDDRFFEHPGVDWRGIVRAAVLDLEAGRLAYGGSTITMQLVRMTEHPEAPRTFRNKLVEAVLALRLERSLGKRAILEHYLNRAYYGNGAYGLEAAAQTYFGKPAAALSDGEATLLAVLPRAPTAYDPLRHLQRAIRRRNYVLGLLQVAGKASAGEVAAARRQALAIAYHAPGFEAPHFTDWVLSELPPELAHGGTIRTTLDLELQRELEHRVAEHVKSLERHGLHQAGAIILDTHTGEVLAAVGSRAWDSRAGQIDILNARRHPGSALKPFIYALAMEAGDNPASIAIDSNDVPSAYHVISSSQPEHGPVRYREALAGSYNLAAVHVLEKVGVPRFMSLLRRAGVGELEQDPREYGLRLALGAAKVRLTNLAAAYGMFVRGGSTVPPTLILSATRPDAGEWRPPAPREVRLVSPASAWLVMDMLSDPVARRPGFGSELPFDLPFRIAAKTGTSRGFADTVAVGVTSEYTVAAWAGNFDGQPTEGLVAMQSAAPLVREGFLLVSRGRDLTLPPPPPDIVAVEVCAETGLRPGPTCHHRKLEHMQADHVPARMCPGHAGGS